MKTSEIGQGKDVLTVIFEFETNPDLQKELAEKIRKLVSEIVSRQPGFIGAHLHLSTDGEKVLNYFQWENMQAFEAFKNSEIMKVRVKPVIGPYSPKPRIYQIIYSA